MGFGTTAPETVFRASKDVDSEATPAGRRKRWSTLRSGKCRDGRQDTEGEHCMIDSWQNWKAVKASF